VSGKVYDKIGENMNIKIKIEGKNKLILDLSDLFYLLHDSFDNEFDAEEFINDLGWIPQIRKQIIKTLKNEYSRGSYNNNVHKERNELLEAMKEKELEYYTNYVADLIEERNRWNNNYWKLWHWYNERLDEHFHTKGSPPDTDKIDFDYREEVAKYIQSVLKQNDKK